MNQNMNQNQINGQQQMGMQQGQMQGQMQGQELNQTQVLNLNDVEQAAQQEKKASQPKKLALFLFLLGVLAIVGGIQYNSIASMLGLETPKSPKTATKDNSNSSTTKQATTDDTTTAKTICTVEQKALTNGTDKTISYELTFDENNKLTSYKKKLDMLPTTGNATGPVTINKYKEGYTTIAGYQIPGYTLILTPTNNGEIAGINVVLNIDLKSFDKTKYSTYNMMNDDVAQVDLELNATKDLVTNTLTGKGYQCK